MQHRGFTLMEVVIYIGLSAVVLVALVGLLLELMNDHAAAEQRAQRHYAAMQTEQTLIRFIERARDADGTIFGSPGTLVLHYNTHPTTTISLVADRLQIIEEGSPAAWLTGETVQVETFMLTNRSSSSSIVIALTLVISGMRTDTSIPLYAR